MRYSDNSSNTHYIPVIPRDLFNESKLLKCMGKVCTLIHDGLAPKGLEFNHVKAAKGFIVDQKPHDGALYISNLLIEFEGHSLSMYTFYNSKDPWPLAVYDDDEEEEVLVLDSRGNFTEEFLELLKRTKHE